MQHLKLGGLKTFDSFQQATDAKMFVLIMAAVQ